MGRMISQLNGNGIHHREIAFCGGRLSIRANKTLQGFDRVMYASISGKEWVPFQRALDREYEQNFPHPIRTGIQLTFDGTPLTFQRFETFPFGYLNEQDGLASWLCVTNDALVFGAAAKSITLSLDLATFKSPVLGLSPGADGKGIHWHSLKRKGRCVVFHKVVPWQYHNESLGMVHDSPTSKLREEFAVHNVYVAFAGNGPVALRREEDGVSVTATARAADARLALGFGNSEEEAIGQATALAAAGFAAFEQEESRYRQVAARLPELQFGRHMQLPEFFALQPLYLESMRIGDEPGAFRANNDYYWVWSWDMTRCHPAMAQSGRWDFMRRNMRFIDDRKQATGENLCEYDGSLSRDLREQFDWDFMPAMIGLHAFCAWSGDLKFAKTVYPGFRNTFHYLQRHMDKGTNLIPGGASTDFPEEFGRTWVGRNAYCNGWWYTAARMFAKLARLLGDGKTAAEADAVADNIRESFLPFFWNERTGFLNENVDPGNEDLVADIPLTTAYAAYDGIYGDDLLSPKADCIAHFAEANFVTLEGIHILPVGDKRGFKEWHRMTNNWFTVNDGFTLRLLRDNGRFDAVNRIFYLYEWNFGLQRSSLEGKPFTRPLYGSNTWQAFGCSTWYRMIVEVGAGIDMDLGGMTIVPSGIGERIRLTGMQYRGATFDFASIGHGRFIQALKVNGTPLAGTYKFQPPDSGHFDVEVEYGPALPATPILLKALDTAVKVTRISTHALEAELDCRGYTAVKFYSRRCPTVCREGRPVDVEWHAGQQTAWVRFNAQGKTKLTLTAG